MMTQEIKNIKSLNVGVDVPNTTLRSKTRFRAKKWDLFRTYCIDGRVGNTYTSLYHQMGSFTYANSGKSVIC